MAHRTADRVQRFLQSPSYLIEQVQASFALGLLNEHDPEFDSALLKILFSQLPSVGGVQAVYALVGDTVVGISAAKHLLATTSSITNLHTTTNTTNTSSCVALDQKLCVNFAGLNSRGQVTSFLGSLQVDRSSLELPVLTNTTTTPTTNGSSNEPLGWSRVRPITTNNNLGITKCSLLHNRTKHTVGRLVVGLTLADLSWFLASVFKNAVDNRVVYIVEEDTGLLVASSIAGVATNVSENGTPVQVLATECANEIIRDVSIFLKQSTVTTDPKQNYATNEHDIIVTQYVEPGLRWNIVVVKPIPIIDDYISTASTLFVVLCAVASACILVSAILCVWVIKFRRLRLWKAAQPSMLVLVLISNMASASCTFVFAGKPSPSICIARQWLGVLSITLTCAVLFAKLVRVYVVVSATRKLPMERYVGQYRRAVGSRGAACLVLGIVCVQVLILAFWTVYDPAAPKLKAKHEANTVVLNPKCSTDATWGFALSRAYVAVVGLSACYLSVVTRNVSETFAESRSLMLVILHGAFIVVMLSLVASYSWVSNQLLMTLVVLALLWFGVTAQIALVLPRVYRQATLGDFSEWQIRQLTVLHLRNETVRNKKNHQIAMKRARQRVNQARRPSVNPHQPNDLARTLTACSESTTVPTMSKNLTELEINCVI